IDKLPLACHRLVVQAVVFLEDIRITEPEIPRQVDHPGPSGNPRNNFHRLAMRQSQENAVQIRQLRRFGRLLKQQVSQPRQVRMNGIDPLASVLTGSDKFQVDIGMKQQYAQQLAAAVAGAAQYSYLDPLSSFSLMIGASRSPSPVALAA